MQLSRQANNAWERYLTGLEEIRHEIYGAVSAASPAGQREAHYLFHQAQAAAFQMAIAPRSGYPGFHTYFDPMFYTWAGLVPDFYYRSALKLDGARTYRIRGHRGTTRMLLLQVESGFWPDAPERMRTLGNYDIDALKVEPDGTFEIVVSATPHEGNWFPLDPQSRSNCILVREAFYDWEHEGATELSIELADGLPSGPWVEDEATYAERLDDALRCMRYPVRYFSGSITDNVVKAVGYHAFHAPTFGGGASSAATYNIAAYDLAPDEALIIESEIPDPKYWGVMLTDGWTQTVDYVFHQSSLNGHQARLDSDGKFRAVVSQRDPMVPNWLDPVDSLRGQVQVRWYYAQRAATPIARKVRFDEIRDYLPADTPSVGPDARAAALSVRRRAVHARYHR